MPHLEIESKFELSATEFDVLKSAGRVSRSANQLNVYYDAQWKLAENAATLRIRFADRSDPVLTLKVPVASQAQRRVMREFEVILPHQLTRLSRSRRPTHIDIARELPEELGEYLLCLGISHVQRMGWVRNTRFVLVVHSVGQIELDRLELPDGSVIHEAEIESADNTTHDSLVRWLFQHAPGARPSRLSKFQRFRGALADGLASPL